MPKYLFRASYTVDGVQGLLKEGGTGRRSAIKQLVESRGGKLETVYYAFGGDDLFIIAEFPDNTSAAAVSLHVAATGAAHINTVVLLTPEEVDKAAKAKVTYRPPGSKK